MDEGRMTHDPNVDSNVGPHCDAIDGAFQTGDPDNGRSGVIQLTTVVKRKKKSAKNKGRMGSDQAIDHARDDDNGCPPSSCSSGSLTPSPKKPKGTPAVGEERPPTIWEPSGDVAVPDTAHSASSVHDVGNKQLPQSFVCEVCQAMGCACGSECPGRIEAQLRLDITQIETDRCRAAQQCRDWCRDVQQRMTGGSAESAERGL